MTATKKRYKILVVDDEVDFVKILRERLEFEGYDTLAAYEGIRAIEMAHKEKPDLVLLDVQMPVGTGATVLNALRGHQETRKIPVIILTGLSGEGLEQEMLDAGAQDFLRKSFDISDLLAKIDLALSNSW